MLLSLIIPFYGVEKYIDDCLMPLRILPKDLCEILLVDDCGHDGSLQIAEKFCSGQENARIIHRTANGGLSAARNTGLDAAEGRYVFFLDSDDIPSPESILTLGKIADAENLDVIMGGYEILDDETGIRSPGPPNPRRETAPGYELFIRKTRADTYEPMVWQCVYRREFLLSHGLRMAEGLLFEDELFTTPALLLAPRTAAVPDTVLAYRQRQGSIMSGFRKGTAWCDSYLSVCRKLTQFDESHPTAASDLLQERIARIALSLGKNIPAYGIEGKAREDAIAFIREHRDEIWCYTRMGRSSALRIQSRLLYAAPELFIRIYALTTGAR